MILWSPNLPPFNSSNRGGGGPDDDRIMRSVKVGLLLCLIISILFLIAAGAFGATTNIITTITITNAANINGTNGARLIVTNADLSISVRTWTNNVFQSSTQMLAGTTIAGDAQALLIHIAHSPFTGLASDGNAISYVRLSGTNGYRVAIVSNWASLTYATQYFGLPSQVVAVPAINQPNAPSLMQQLAYDLETYATNPPIALFATNLGPSNLTSRTLMQPNGSTLGFKALAAGSNTVISSTPTSVVISATSAIAGPTGATGASGASQWTNSNGLLFPTNASDFIQISNNFLRIGYDPDHAFASRGYVEFSEDVTNAARVVYFNTLMSGSTACPAISMDIFEGDGTWSGTESEGIKITSFLHPNGGHAGLYGFGGNYGINSSVNWWDFSGPLAGEGIGVFGQAKSSASINYGVAGEAMPGNSGGTNIGVAGEAVTALLTGGDATGVFVGGYFGVTPRQSTNVQYESSVLLLDGRNVAVDLIVGRTNTPAGTAPTKVFRVSHSGDLNLINKVAYTWPTANGNPGSTLTDTNGFGNLTWQSGKRIYAWKTNADYALTTSDYYLGVDTTGSAVTISLPTAASSSNFTWIVKDEGGQAGANRIGILLQAGDGIEGAITNAITSAYGTLRIVSRGNTNFFLW